MLSCECESEWCIHEAVLFPHYVKRAKKMLPQNAGGAERGLFHEYVRVGLVTYKAAGKCSLHRCILRGQITLEKNETFDILYCSSTEAKYTHD